MPRKPTTTQVSRTARAELRDLAQAMALTAIGARGAIPAGEQIRQIVREARELLSEVDTPTRAKTPRKPRKDEAPPSEAEYVPDDYDDSDY